MWKIFFFFSVFFFYLKVKLYFLEIFTYFLDFFYSLNFIKQKIGRHVIRRKLSSRYFPIIKHVRFFTLVKNGYNIILGIVIGARSTNSSYGSKKEEDLDTVTPLSSYHWLLLVPHLDNPADWPIWATNSSPYLVV